MLVAVLIGGSFGGGLVSYTTGRIILPEMGLIAPSYWPWFWVWFIGLIVASVITLIKEAF